MYPVCRGPDVHKESISACVMCPDKGGAESIKKTRYSESCTGDLMPLRPRPGESAVQGFPQPCLSFRRSCFVRFAKRLVSSRTATPLAALLRQAGSELKSGLSAGFYKIELDGFGPFQEVFVDCKGDSLLRKNRIVFLRLIQSHGQRGGASTALQKNPDRGGPVPVRHKILDHVPCFFRNFDHGFSLLEIKIGSRGSLPERPVRRISQRRKAECLTSCVTSPENRQSRFPHPR